MSILRFAHLADTHLLDSQYGRVSRSKDFLDGFLNAIRAGLNVGVTLFLHGGDIINSTRPSPRILEQLREVDQLLVSKKAALLLITGNHDLTNPHWISVSLNGKDPLANFLKNEVSYGINLIDNQLVKLGGFSIYGLPFVPKEKFLEMRDGLPQADVLLMHAAVQEFIKFPSESALTMAELPTGKYKMIALGDIHVRDYQFSGDCLVGYPGSTELCSASEEGEKSITVVTLEPGKAPTYEFVPFKTRKVLKYVMKSEEDVEQSLLDVQLHREEGPIVVAKFLPGLKDVVTRFQARIDPSTSILLDYPMLGNVVQGDKGADVRPALKPIDFLDKFIPAGTALYDLGAAVINETMGTSEGVDHYVDRVLTPSGS